MGSHTLSSLVARYQKDPAAFRREFPHPWLVMEPITREGAPVMTTGKLDVVAALAKNAGDLVALPVVKHRAGNAFAFGITLGHAENNDLVLRDASVSRFHAYLQQSGKTWSVTDADSKNGTFVDGARAASSKPKALGHKAALRLGTLELRFFTAEGFAEFLVREAAARRPPQR
jgi:hypothetical protein